MTRFSVHSKYSTSKALILLELSIEISYFISRKLCKVAFKSYIAESAKTTYENNSYETANVEMFLLLNRGA